MRREGRLHGMTRTFNILPEHLNPRPPSRILNKVDSPPTAGLFIKINSKPTNHSKFTGKCPRTRCADCHIFPPGKSKDKSKGSQKTKSSDANLDYKSITWKVFSNDRQVSVDKPLVAGYSASKILGELSYDYESSNVYDEEDYEEDVDEEEDVKDESCMKMTRVVVHDDDDDIIIHGGVMDDEDDGYMGFYDCSVVWNAVNDDDDCEDDGWSFVGGM